MVSIAYLIKLSDIVHHKISICCSHPYTLDCALVAELGSSNIRAKMQNFRKYHHYPRQSRLKKLLGFFTRPAEASAYLAPRTLVYLINLKIMSFLSWMYIYRGTSSCTKGKRLILSMEGFWGLIQKITEITIQHQLLWSLLSSSSPTEHGLWFCHDMQQGLFLSIYNI